MIVSLLGCGGVFLYFLSLRPITILPSNPDFKFYLFTDTANAGNSQISRYAISDSTIHLDFELRKGFVDPYVSISVSPKHQSTLDLSFYNRLVIDIQGFNTKNIGFDLITPYRLQTHEILKDTIVDFYYNLINISPERQQYTVDFQELKVPDYWYVDNNLAPNVKIHPDLKRVLSFNIGTAYATQFNVPQSVRLYGIRFERNNSRTIAILLGIELLVVVLLVMVHYLRAWGHHRKRQVTISYKPIDVPIESPQIQHLDIVDYINHHFHDTELSLEQVANHLGISQRTITGTIQKTFGCHFKTYLNQLRIHESKRLLKKSDLSMGEIAFKVGFNTQSHFNRVFKSMEGISPTEFRNTDS